MSTEAIVGGAVAACAVAVLGGVAWLRRRGDGTALKDAAESVARLESAMTRREAEIDDRLASAAAMEADIASAREALQHRLAEVAGLEPAEALARLIEELEGELAAERERLVHLSVEATRQEAAARARDVVLTAIGRLRAEAVVEATTTRIPLPTDELKGRIIGREGRNVRALEAATGCDVIVDETPGVVVVSSFDGVRREVARRTLVRLIEEGRIQPGRIEEVAEEERRRVEGALEDDGRAAAAEAGAGDLRPELQHAMGRLRYRTSYGQNVLRHAVEVAHLSGLMASELGLDPAPARRAGFLHDLGKALDSEADGSHSEAAARLLRRLGEPDLVVQAVEAHHDDSEGLAPYAVLVRTADAISAARPGARRENAQLFLERVQELESLAASFPGVDKAYAIHAGREVRVLVDAGTVGDEASTHLAWQIARRIEQDLAWKADVRVTVIRELRATDTARSGGVA